MLSYLEHRMFKAVPGGYIFQPPPPTSFTTTEAYLVDEAKKAEILTITRAGGVTAGRVVTFGSLAMAMAAGVAMSIGDAPMAATIVIVFCIFLVAQIAGTCFVLYWKLRRLRPVLAGLPRSDERLFPQIDRRRLLWGPPPPHAAAFWCAVCGFLLGYNSTSHLPFTSVSSTIYLVIFAVSLFWAIHATSKSLRDTNATETRRVRKEESHVNDVQPQAQSPDAIERLASRLERQEGYLMGLRLIVPGIMILVVTGFGFSLGLFKHSAADAQTVVAEAFALKNSSGDIVARLGSTPDGAPGIAFFDKEHNLRLVVGLRADGGPSVSLVDPQHAPRAVLSLNNQHDPSLTMFNTASLPRAVFSLDGGDQGGNGHVILYGAGGGLDLSSYDGRVRWNPRGGAPQDVPAPK
jgi:hypothetical protein